MQRGENSASEAPSLAPPRENWWNRPCGGRQVLALALPLVISTASWTFMHFVDRMYLMWYSPVAMAASMPAGMLHFTMLCFPLGMASYVNTFVAQYHGAQRSGRIGVALWQGMRVGLLATPAFLLLVPLAPLIFNLAGHDPQMTSLEIIYFQVMAFGSGAAVLSAALSAFFSGRGAMRTVMVVDSSAAVLNIVLDYAWVFGHWGFPKLGIEGAAWATVVSLWAKVIVYWLLIDTYRHREKYQLTAGRRYDADLWRRLVRYGGVNGLHMLVEVAAFTVFIMLVGQLGTDAMTATTLAFQVNSVAFVPMLGVGTAVSTLVGQQLGAGRPDLAARGVWTSLGVALAYMGAFSLLYLTVPEWFLGGHAAGTDPTAFERLRGITVILLRFVAAYCLFDAFNVVFASAIKGAGDTHFVLWTNVIVSPFPVIIGWLGIRYAGWGLLWCWVVITAWIVLLGLIYLARFLHGSWQHMRVIEPDEPEPLPAIDAVVPLPSAESA